ncbi:23S rRNA (adenine(2503)-C(2))-methyltransferase RlmN [Geomicrobium sp. JSM 1781026]|uniref:23S rRNA (adenine(2503)-C(2))-methyltransferase RlmN n=1 Tax=unclassified Geomicrobium TaxID=2628951 RepID=UPI00045F3D4C|nr:23S rRNA (adenine(2503)-C(2))-methyltransferase RlmN [Geomicrobium sp. JCM 19039]GAK10867.1 ribosomal RNA large subunit methyltransferase N [Geomicrobium sp. JCM 19039]
MKTVTKNKRDVTATAEGSKRSIFSLTFDDWKQWMSENSQPQFRAKQMYEWLYRKRVESVDEMTNLPLDLREKLNEEFMFTRLKEVLRQTSVDGTEKFLFELHDGYSIETVLMRHDYGNSICVTTQVGCRLGCTFCASTLGGLKRNLEAGEITAQVLDVQRALDETGERVDSIVVMGIGEPFDNYDHLMGFLRTVNHDEGLNIGARHITVSTSGMVPKIYKFADEGMQINFAISLHAPNSEIRGRLMPINKAFPVSKLMDSIVYYQQKTKRRVTFEYGLFGGVNDQVEHAEELAELIKDIRCHVNLIPVNDVPERDYVRTSREDIFAFEKTLKDKGVLVTIRREQGHDIDAACGQLRAKERAEETRE